MAVARPRNNLQQHLSLFDTAKPQVPPVGPVADYTSSTASARQLMSSVALPTTHTSSASSVQQVYEAEMPTPAPLRNPVAAQTQPETNSRRTSLGRTKEKRLQALEQPGPKGVFEKPEEIATPISTRFFHNC